MDSVWGFLYIQSRILGIFLKNIDFTQAEEYNNLIMGKDGDVMKYYIEMWKHTFDYKGKSTRKEFWIPFAINAGLALILLVFTVLKIIFSTLIYPIIIISAVLVLSVVPFISLTVRRLHDTGRSGWWYCLIFGFGVGAIILLMMCASVLQAFNPDTNIGGCVYEPPDYYEPGNNTNAPVYGPPPEMLE